jgi:hypothetical protein
VWVPLCGAVEAPNSADEHQNRARGPSSSYASRLSVVSRTNTSHRGSENRAVGGGGAQSTSVDAVEMVDRRLHEDGGVQTASPSTSAPSAECRDAAPALTLALSTDSVALVAVEVEAASVECDSTIDNQRVSRDPMKQFLSQRGSALLNAPGAQARAHLFESISAMQQQQASDARSSSSSPSSSSASSSTLQEV